MKAKRRAERRAERRDQRGEQSEERRGEESEGRRNKQCMERGGGRNDGYVVCGVVLSGERSRGERIGVEWSEVEGRGEEVRVVFGFLEVLLKIESRRSNLK